MPDEKAIYFEEITAVAPLSKVSTLLLLGAVFFAALSGLTHTIFHSVSIISLFVALGLGFFAFIKVLNRLAPDLPSFLIRPIHWIHALSFELLAFAAVAILRLVPRKPRPQGTGPRPILLVHGYCNHGSVWAYLQPLLAKLNVGPVYTINLGHPFRSIQEYAKHVSEKAAAIRSETNQEHLILIGHSMGGLVSAFYAAKMAPAHSVTDVITLSSPLGGTHVARLALGPNGKEMRLASQFVQQLKSLIQAKPDIRFYHIATRTDQIVFPSQSALLGNNPSREFVFEDIGHASLLFSPRVAAKISEWLRKI
jgi:triacylglycerol esterase/lipase EstA (alpha/beta hydrolase family)